MFTAVLQSILKTKYTFISLNNCHYSEWVLSVQYLMVVQSILLKRTDKIDDIKFLNIIHLLMYMIKKKDLITILNFKFCSFEDIMYL